MSCHRATILDSVSCVNLQPMGRVPLSSGGQIANDPIAVQVQVQVEMGWNNLREALPEGRQCHT